MTRFQCKKQIVSILKNSRVINDPKMPKIALLEKHVLTFKIKSAYDH